MNRRKPTSKHHLHHAVTSIASCGTYNRILHHNIHGVYIHMYIWSIVRYYYTPIFLSCPLPPCLSLTSLTLHSPSHLSFSFLLLSSPLSLSTPHTITPSLTLFYFSSGHFCILSAGVGRTGSFLAIHLALEQAKTKGYVDIPAIIFSLRRQRMKMVQTQVIKLSKL